MEKEQIAHRIISVKLHEINYYIINKKDCMITGYKPEIFKPRNGEECHIIIRQELKYSYGETIGGVQRSYAGVIRQLNWLIAVHLKFYIEKNEYEHIPAYILRKYNYDKMLQKYIFSKSARK